MSDNTIHPEAGDAAVSEAEIEAACEAHWQIRMTTLSKTKEVTLPWSDAPVEAKAGSRKYLRQILEAAARVRVASAPALSGGGEGPAPVALENCPAGLFVSASGELGLKVEYQINDNRQVSAYVARTGEFFWGGAESLAAQRRVMVTPVAHPPAVPAGAGVSEAEVEAAAYAIWDICNPHEIGIIYTPWADWPETPKQASLRQEHHSRQDYRDQARNALEAAARVRISSASTGTAGYREAMLRAPVDSTDTLDGTDAEQWYRNSVDQQAEMEAGEAEVFAAIRAEADAIPAERPQTGEDDAAFVERMARGEAYSCSSGVEMSDNDHARLIALARKGFCNGPL